MVLLCSSAVQKLLTHHVSQCCPLSRACKHHSYNLEWNCSWATQNTWYAKYWQLLLISHIRHVWQQDAKDVNVEDGGQWCPIAMWCIAINSLLNKAMMLSTSKRFIETKTMVAVKAIFVLYSYYTVYTVFISNLVYISLSTVLFFKFILMQVCFWQIYITRNGK